MTLSSGKHHFEWGRVYGERKSTAIGQGGGGMPAGSRQPHRTMADMGLQVSPMAIQVDMAGLPLL